MSAPDAAATRRLRVAAELQLLLTRWAADAGPSSASVSIDTGDGEVSLYLGIAGVRGGRSFLLASESDIDRLIEVAEG